MALKKDIKEVNIIWSRSSLQTKILTNWKTATIKFCEVSWVGRKQVTFTLSKILQTSKIVTEYKLDFFASITYK